MISKLLFRLTRALTRRASKIEDVKMRRRSLPPVQFPSKRAAFRVIIPLFRGPLCRVRVKAASLLQHTSIINAEAQCVRYTHSFTFI